VSAVAVVGLAVGVVGMTVGLVEAHGHPVGGLVGFAVGITLFGLAYAVMR